MKTLRTKSCLKPVWGIVMIVFGGIGLIGTGLLTLAMARGIVSGLEIFVVSVLILTCIMLILSGSIVSKNKKNIKVFIATMILLAILILCLAIFVIPHAIRHTTLFGIENGLLWLLIYYGINFISIPILLISVMFFIILWKACTQQMIKAGAKELPVARKSFPKPGWGIALMVFGILSLPSSILYFSSALSSISDSGYFIILTLMVVVANILLLCSGIVISKNKKQKILFILTAILMIIYPFTVSSLIPFFVVKSCLTLFSSSPAWCDTVAFPSVIIKLTMIIIALVIIFKAYLGDPPKTKTPKSVIKKSPARKREDYDDPDI